MDTNWKLYRFAKEAWEAMLADIEDAQRTIDIEQYIFIDDEIGNRFLDALKRKSGAGVRVRLLCDMVGSANFYLSLTRLQELQKTGVEVRFFHPIKLWRIHNFTSWFFRDHRKILIIDSGVAYTGGVGINLKMKDWRDTVVQISGPIILQMNQVFEKMWKAAEDRTFPIFTSPDTYDDGFSFFTNSPHRRQRFVHRRYIDMIRSAQRYAYLCTPYLVPDRRLFRVIRLAAHRGVDVRLILPQESDVGLVDAASRRYIEPLLKTGVKVYHYPSEVFMHSKVAIVDDTWSTVGSCNLDNRSFLWNYEANLISSAPGFASDLKQQFLEDLKNSSQLDLKTWQQRPFLAKLKEWATWPIHYFL